MLRASFASYPSDRTRSSVDERSDTDRQHKKSRPLRRESRRRRPTFRWHRDHGSKRLGEGSSPSSLARPLQPTTQTPTSDRKTLMAFHVGRASLPPPLPPLGSPCSSTSRLPTHHHRCYGRVVSREGPSTGRSSSTSSPASAAGSGRGCGRGTASTTGSAPGIFGSTSCPPFHPSSGAEDENRPARYGPARERSRRSRRAPRRGASSRPHLLETGSIRSKWLCSAQTRMRVTR